MTKEQFVRMMDATEAFEQEIERWNDFGIELYELPIGEIPWEMFNCWLHSNFNEFGVDWINWYLFERISVITHRVLPCYDEEGNKVFLNTADDLWEWVKGYVIND